MSKATQPHNSDTSNNQPVEIVVPEGYTWFFVQNPTDKIDRLLSTNLSWKDPDAKYTDQYRNGSWDGYHRLYKEDNHGAPIGLLDKAISTLEDHGYTTTTTIKGDKTGDTISADWDFEHQLRDYQKDAVNKTLAENGGIISLPTGAGKTVTALKLVEKIEQRAIIFVHTTELLYQWETKIKEILNIEPGIIGDDQWEEGPLTVATMQTLMNRGLGNLNESYGIGIFDECHVTSAADKMQEVGLDITVDWRIGLSATPWRQIPAEKLEIEAAIGETVIDISAEQLIEDGFLAEPQFEYLPVPDQRTPKSNSDYHQAVRNCIELAPNRNQTIASKAAELADNGYQVLVTVNRINHGKLIEYVLRQTLDSDQIYNEIADDDDTAVESKNKTIAVNDLDQLGEYNARFLCAKENNTTQRDEILSQFQDGDLNILISTIVKEGVDIPEISAAVLAEGGKSKTEKIQRIGRALRPENGDHAKIVDIKDKGKFLSDHTEKRIQAFNEYYGDYGPNENDSQTSPKVAAVENYLKQNGVNTNPCTIEEANSGKVLIKLTDYLSDPEFNTFMQVIRQTNGISYNGDHNECSPRWVQQLTKSDNGVSA